ncbi:MAG: hypothetical protein ABI318_18085 [Chthoniobacteraceae bacterium]
MNPPAPYRIELLKLADGRRILRVTDTSLERCVNPKQPVARQKEAVIRALRAVLERELKEPAAV